jgi:hypothetical protein
VEQTGYVVLNKIDGLRDGFKPGDADPRGDRPAAEVDLGDAEGGPETHLRALRQAGASSPKIHDDRDGLIKSRLYRLEQALAAGMLRSEESSTHATAVRANRASRSPSRRR